MLYRTMCALSILGDRIEKGNEIELTAEQAASFDPADLVPVESIPADPDEEVLPDVPLDEMSLDQLKAKAAELGLKATGTKAAILERITLHLSAPKHVVTQDDLDANPALVEEGVKVGDEIDLPNPEEETTNS